MAQGRIKGIGKGQALPPKIGIGPGHPAKGAIGIGPAQIAKKMALREMMK